MMKVARKWLCLLLCTILFCFLAWGGAASEITIESTEHSQLQTTVSSEIGVSESAVADESGEPQETVEQTVVYDDQLIIMAPYFSRYYRNEYKGDNNLLEGLCLPVYMLGDDDLPISVFPLDEKDEPSICVGEAGRLDAVKAIQELSTNSQGKQAALKTDTVAKVGVLLGYNTAEQTTEESSQEQTDAVTTFSSTSQYTWQAKRSTVLFFSTSRLEQAQEDLLVRMSQDENVEVFHVVIRNNSEDSLINVTDLLNLDEIKKPEAGKIYVLLPNYHAIFVNSEASAVNFYKQLLEYLDSKLNANNTGFMPLKGNEHERFMTLHGAATLYTRLYLANLAEDDIVTFTDESGQPIEAQLLYKAYDVAAYEIPGSHGNRINVTIGDPDAAPQVNAEGGQTAEAEPSTFAVQAFYNYAIEEDYISIKLNREDADNTYIKNRDIEYTITFSISTDSSTNFDQLFKDINVFDNTNCSISWTNPFGEEKLINTEKQIDDNNFVYYTATIALDTAGDYLLTPRLEIGNHIIDGEPLSVTVTNRAPEIATSEDPLQCWFDNPWITDDDSKVEIPLDVKDADQDQLNYAILDDEGNMAPLQVIDGIGKLKVDADGVAVIALESSAAMRLEPFTFQVMAYEQDAPDSYSAADISFRLLSMKECLQKVTLSPVDIVPAAPRKYETITLSLSAIFDGLDDRIPVDDVRKAFQDHIQITAQAYQLLNGERVPIGEPFMLKKAEDTQLYTGSYTLGDTSMELVFDVTATYMMPEGTVESTLLPLTASSATIAIGNMPPSLKEGQITEPVAAMLLDDDDTGERWSTQIDLSTLYSDAENDTVKYRVQILSDGLPCPIEQNGNQIVLRKAATTSGSPAETPLTEFITAEAGLVELEFRATGAYEIVVGAKDNECDWQDSYRQRITLDSTLEKLIRTCILIAIGVVLTIILILVLIYCTKKAYGQRVLHVRVAYHAWIQQSDVPLTEWKKKKVPFHWILSCAAFPPDEMVYSACSKVFLSPAGKGVQLIDNYGLNLSAESIKNKRNRYLLGDDEQMEIRFPKQEDASWDDVVITLSLKA